MTNSQTQAGMLYLLHDIAHGRTLIQQPQLAGLVCLVCWVAVDAAVQHGSVEVTYQGSNVPASTAQIVWSSTDACTSHSLTHVCVS